MRLRAYGADRLEALTQENAQVIIEKFEAGGIAPANPAARAKENDNAES